MRSSNKGLNSLGLKSADALYKLLSNHYQTVGISVVNTLEDLKVLTAKRPDLVFIGMKYVMGTDSNSKIWVSSYLTRYGIAHTGSPLAAIKLEQSKQLAKQHVINAGIASSPFYVVKHGSSFDALSVFSSFPLFVKPTSLGAGLGVDEKSIVHNQTQLEDKLCSLSMAYSTDSLVETYLEGREFSVAVLKDEVTGKLIGMPLELLPDADVNGDKMLSSRLKTGALETPVAYVQEQSLRNKLTNLALDVFQVIGARDYGRIDIRLDGEGVPHFLEANLIPCIIEGSGNFPKACMLNRGMDYEEMILRIVRLGLMRSRTHTGDYTELLSPSSSLDSLAVA